MMKAKRFFGIFLIAALLVGALSVSALAASVVKTGKCGEKANFTLYSDGLLVISGSGTVAGNRAYYEDANVEYDNFIRRVEIKTGITEIGSYAFDCCKALESIELPTTLTSVAHGAFAGCQKLKSVYIPASVIEIAPNAFDACSSMTAFTVDPKNTVFRSVNGALTDKEQCTLIRVPCGITGAFAIPEGIVYCNPFAFRNISKLSALIIPTSVQAIYEHSIEYCYELKDVYYLGSEEEWSNVVVYDSNDSLTAATLHFNSIIDWFVDVPDDAWYEAAVDYVSDNGLMSGIGEYRFAPTATMTRAQMVQILYSMAGKPSVANMDNPFTDVKATDWYGSAVIWAYNIKVTSGTTATTFSPNGKLTREQVAAFLYAYASSRGDDMSATSELTFPDAEKVSAWALTATRWAVAKGLISGKQSGTSTLLAPVDTCTRAEMAAMMTKFSAK